MQNITVTIRYVILDSSMNKAKNNVKIRLGKKDEDEKVE